MGFHVPSEDSIAAALGLEERPVHVGTGGFKAVYRISSESGEEALKAVYIPSSGVGEEVEDTEGAQLFARAEREIEALRDCATPSLVRLGSRSPTLVNVDGFQYLVYTEEFLPGGPLTSWIGRKPQPTFEELREIFVSLLEVIKALTDRGFLHRDIKPGNVMVTGIAERPYVVLDLGIAFKIHATELTQGAGPPGTLRYMAPELLKPDYKATMDFRCDLYAAGLTVYVVASGVHPFAPKPEHDYATAFRIFNERPASLADLRPDLPAGFCSIIDRCLKKKPALRYANLDLVMRAIAEVA